LWRQVSTSTWTSRARNRIDELKLQRTHVDRRVPAESLRQPLMVCIRFAPGLARWVRGRQPFGFPSEAAAEAGAGTGVAFEQARGVFIEESTGAVSRWS